VFSEDGASTGTGTFVLRSGNRLAQTLPELVPGFPGQMRGWVRVTTEGGPIVACEIFGNSASDFLVAVPPQPIPKR
jgi:hypothetical protein